jgi:hypothetical protein
MKKQHIIYLVIGVTALVLIVGVWYVQKSRSCLKQVSYVPPREQTENGVFSWDRTNDKGDYYRFGEREFRISEEAIRACIWQ